MSGVPNRLTQSADLNKEIVQNKEQVVGVQEYYNVYCDAVADLYHIGHVNFLNAAYDQGVKCAHQKFANSPRIPKVHMIVGIHNDKTVETYKRAPINTMKERISVVEHHYRVFKVIPNAPLVLTENYLKKHNIDLVCGNAGTTGDPYYDSFNHVPKQLKMFAIIPRTPSISTTTIIDRVIKRANDALVETFGGSPRKD